jgi:NAD(P)-dependent dehydrogenase (short-subunit alcohol dehydrogenase family)
MKPLFDVSGKTVLITGGSSGFGLEAVRLFLSQGARVVSVSRSRDPDSCDAEGRKLTEHNALLQLEYDLSEPGSVSRTLERTSVIFGTPDVVINNAGISLMERAERVTEADWDALMRINLFACFEIAQQAARAMKDGGGGSIINISSILAERALPGSAVYSMSKSAINQMTRSLALEWGRHGIRVNAIAPGWFASRMSQDIIAGPGGEILRQKNPMRRFAGARDFDGVLLLLASDAGAYINGAIIPVDGGQSLT